MPVVQTFMSEKFLLDKEIKHLLGSSRELSLLCSQNGWIDSDSIGYEVKGKSSDTLQLTVSFEEIIMEGSGCTAGRVPCFGQVLVGVESDSDLKILSVSR